MRGQGSVYKRGQIWWISYWHNNTPYRFSSRSTKRSEAQQLLNAKIAERDQGVLPHSRSPRLRMQQIFQQYCTDLELRNVPSLETSVRSHLKPLQTFFANYRPEQVTPALVDSYKKSRRQLGRAVSTVNVELRLLRTALRFAYKRQQIPRVPQFQFLEGEHVREGFLEWEDLQAILPHLPGYLRPWVQFAYWTGWRRKELNTLEWRDIDWENSAIRLRPVNSKTRRGRVVGMSQPLRELLQQQWDARVLEGRIVPYVFHHNGRPIGRHYKAWKKAWKLAGRPAKLLHDTRRSAVRNMINAGVPERHAMQVTGHTSRSVFDRYTIVTTAQTEAALDRTAEYVTRQQKKVVNLREDT